MPVRFRSTFSPSDFSARVLKACQDAMEETVNDAVDYVKFFISTRGTVKTGKQGRVESGRWIDSIFGGTDTSGKIVSGGIGDEFSETGDRDAWYMFLQDDGFTHISGEQIPGVNAFIDTYPLMRDELLRNLADRLAREL